MKSIRQKMLVFCILQAVACRTSAFVVRGPATHSKLSTVLRSAPPPPPPPGGDAAPVGARSRMTTPQAPPSGALSTGGGAPTKDRSSQPPLSPSKIWNTSKLVRVEGDSLRTWDVNPGIDAMQLLMKTEGRPLNAKVELWHGPDYTPSKLGVYIEDGDLRPFNAIIATPLAGNTIAVYNTAAQEYPLTACAYGNMEDGSAGLVEIRQALAEESIPKVVQGGGMVAAFPFDASVQSIQILLKTDGRNLNARIELLQGPNNLKQVMEYYSSDGYKRPFYAILESPGNGNMIRIVNQNTVEYPFTAQVEPYLVETGRFPGRPTP